MATASEDYRERLERTRDALEARMEGASDRDFAPLVARYQSVLTELATLPNPNAEADTVESAQAAIADRLRPVQ